MYCFNTTNGELVQTLSVSALRLGWCAGAGKVPVLGGRQAFSGLWDFRWRRWIASETEHHFRPSIPSFGRRMAI